MTGAFVQTIDVAASQGLAGMRGFGRAGLSACRRSSSRNAVRRCRGFADESLASVNLIA